MLREKAFFMAMIGEINRKRPQEDQIPDFGFPRSKYAQVYREYRRLYPDGKLLIYYWVAGAACALGLVFTLLFLGLLGLVLPP